MVRTKEKIAESSPEKRETLVDNTKARRTPGAQQIIDLIEHDLLVRAGGGLSREHATIKEWKNHQGR